MLTFDLYTNEKIDFNNTSKAKKSVLEVTYGVLIALLTIAAIDPRLITWWFKYKQGSTVRNRKMLLDCSYRIWRQFYCLFLQLSQVRYGGLNRPVRMLLVILATHSSQTNRYLRWSLLWPVVSSSGSPCASRSNRRAQHVSLTFAGQHALHAAHYFTYAAFAEHLHHLLRLFELV